MKLGIISDIHGNYFALKQVLDTLHQAGCTSILCLGDVTGYYSMVNECIGLLRAESVFSLKGNHDSYLLGEGQCPRSNSVNRCIAYQKEVITPDNLAWLAALKPQYRGADYAAVHGGWRDPLDEYIDRFDFAAAAAMLPDCRMFLSGHTHIQTLQTQDGITYCNPGSVGQPRDHDPRAAYAILEDGEITLGRVAYDIDATVEQMRLAGFTEYFYQNLYYGCKIGEYRGDAGTT